MKKFVFIVLIIAGVIYYKWDYIIAKKNEMKIKSFQELQTQFWKDVRSVKYKSKLEKAFKDAEKAIISGAITSVEYEDVKRIMIISSKDQVIDTREARDIVNIIEQTIKGSEPIIRNN